MEPVLPATLLPGKDGQELQGVGWGQGGIGWPFSSVLGGNLCHPNERISGASTYYMLSIALYLWKEGNKKNKTAESIEPWVWPGSLFSFYR